MKELYEIILKSRKIPFYEYEPIQYFSKIYQKHIFDIFNDRYYNVFKFNRRVFITYSIDDDFDPRRVCEEFVKADDLDGTIKIWNSIDHTYYHYCYILVILELAIKYNRCNIFKYFVKYSQAFESFSRQNDILEMIISNNCFSILKCIDQTYNLCNIFSEHDMGYAIYKSIRLKRKKLQTIFFIKLKIFKKKIS